MNGRRRHRRDARARGTAASSALGGPVAAQDGAQGPEPPRVAVRFLGGPAAALLPRSVPIWSTNTPAPPTAADPTDHTDHTNRTDHDQEATR